MLRDKKEEVVWLWVQLSRAGARPSSSNARLHSLYVVREIDNATDRNLVRWSYITFDHLAQFASWGSRAGGTNMQGGASAVVRIPRSEFTPLTAATLETHPESPPPRKRDWELENTIENSQKGLDNFNIYDIA